QLASQRFDYLRASRVMRELVEMGICDLRLQGYSAAPTISRSMEARYVGQNYELELPVPTDQFDSDSSAALWEAFHEVHDRRFGFSMPGENIEIVNFKVSLLLPGSKPILPEVPKAKAEPVPRCSRTVYFAGGRVDTAVISRSVLRSGHQVVGP